MTYEVTDGRGLAHMFRTYFVEGAYQFEAVHEDPYIVDCGANVGVGVRYWKTLYPQARVIAFEADADVYSCLETNTRGLPDVEVVPKAVWSSDGVVRFAAVGADGGHVAAVADRDDGVPEMEVEAVRLATYLDRPIDLLKMDIEGAEMDVLRDCRDRLECVRNLFVEYHSFVGKRQELAELFAILEGAGFRTYASVESPASQPFVDRPVYNQKDFRLNVWAFRT